VEVHVRDLVIHSIEGAGGARIAVRTAGTPEGPPIVFVHGWARSHADWSAQLTDPTLTDCYHLIAPDLRGHGDSDAPENGYDDPAVWAADVAEVLDFAGAPAVLVGSSYGGLVITDYLRILGDRRVTGLLFAGALTEIGPGNPGGAVGELMGPGLRDYLSPDPAVAIPALTTLTWGLTAEPADGETIQRRLGEFLRVPPRVRRALFRRSVSSAEVLASIRLPTLLVHGTADRVVDPSAAEYASGKIPGASMRWFHEVGHLPFVERFEEFNHVLHELTDRCWRAHR
jgi:non-heme chloroperoxidase